MRIKRGSWRRSRHSSLSWSRRGGEAVELFQTKMVGIPDEVVAQLRHAPFRPSLETIAHTLVYETIIMGAMAGPTELTRSLASIAVPLLAISGGQSPAFMHHGAQALADTLPNAQYRLLPGQTHDIEASVLAPVLEEFFAG
jgi:pimeloyl-ACP methyl ester carboxylesterase